MSPSTPPTTAGGTPSPKLASVADCDGALAVEVKVYSMPHGGTVVFDLERDGRIRFSAPQDTGAALACSGTLQHTEHRALAARVDALALHELPARVTVPTIRDGITIVVKGSCGAHAIDATARNIFPATLRTLMDSCNEIVLGPHCDAGARLPSSAALLDWSDSTGATQVCADDCAQCNTCGGVRP